MPTTNQHGPKNQDTGSPGKKEMPEAGNPASKDSGIKQQHGQQNHENSATVSHGEKSGRIQAPFSKPDSRNQPAVKREAGYAEDTERADQRAEDKNTSKHESNRPMDKSAQRKSSDK